MPAALRSRLPVGSLTAARLRGITLRRLAEAAGVALGVVAFATLAALASYNPGDPSFDTATPVAPTNLLGATGAAAADLLIQGFGMACLLPPLAMLGWAWRIASHRGLQAPALRLLALCCAVPACAAAFAGVMLLLGGHGWSWPGPAGPGGAVGEKLSQMTFGAGRALIGPYGGVALWGLGGLLALVLAPLSLGLSAGEWRAAGRRTRSGIKGGAARLRRGEGGQRFWQRRRPHPDALVDHASEPVSSGRSPIAAQKAAQNAAQNAAALVVPASARREPSLTPSGGYMLPPGQDQDDIAATSLPPASRRKPAPPETTSREGGLSSIRKLLGVRGNAEPAPRARPEPRPQRPAPDPDTTAWTLPPLSLLQAAPPRAGGGPSPESLQANARLLETVLSDYGVQGAIGAIHAGPVVTLYELEPAPGIRSARVIGLADDIARSLSVTAVRIATVPGRNVIGIEVPNARRETVYFSELLDADAWHENTSRLCLALGKDIAGAPVYADLARMPHLLIAGTTGSGKSVGVNAMILSLLYRLSPEECRLILIDPKMLELSIYDGIPHLMAPVVTEPAKAVTALKWTVREMERRYRGMSQLGVRNMLGYNERVAAARAAGEVLMRRVQTGFDPETGKPTFDEQPLKLERLPYIVVVIDEMADLMMVAGKEIEAAVQRLAQMARAAGIHVIAATQRPSVDVITGTIKANFPTRISFQVISKFDSRTILGEQGSEQLLGQGDMLFMQGGGRITRVHGPFVGDTEVEDVVRHLRQQGEPDYMEDVTSVFEEEPSAASAGGNGLDGAGFDSETGLFDQAVTLVAREGKASTSFIQRHLSIGYNRAAKLIEQMEKQGIVGPANHVGKREVLVRREAAEQD